MIRFLASMAVFFMLLNSVAYAQEEADKSSFIQFVEGKLSTGNRQIRLNGLRGTLSSNVLFDSITIADDQGIWLTIVEPQLIWNRSALLRGRLEITSLKAAAIEMPRGPMLDESLPAPEASGFTLPELPVGFIIGDLDVPIIRFGESVFGLTAEISVKGSASLENNMLRTELDILRLDGPGGALRMDIDYQGEAETIALDIRLEEPANGMIANLTGLKDEPAIALAIKGNAPIDDLSVNLAFDVGQRRILDGILALNGQSGGTRITADFGGPLASILPVAYGDLLGTQSQLHLEALRKTTGALTLDRFLLSSGAIDISANAQMLADGFWSAINIEAKIADQTAMPVEIPTADGGVRFDKALLSLDYDAAKNAAFQQRFKINNLESSFGQFGNVALDITGTIAELADATRRSIQFTMDGAVNGLRPHDPKLAEALGNRLMIAGAGAWATGQPLSVTNLALKGADYTLRATGDLQSAVFTGGLGLEIADLTPFSALAGRSLEGNIGLAANGTIEPISGAFDLALNGIANGLKTDDLAVDRLLAGATSLSGAIMRSAEGLQLDRVRLINNQSDILLDGRYASAGADISAEAILRDIADISEAGRGALTARITMKGQDKGYDLDAMLAMPQGVLSGKAAQDIALNFDGALNDGALAGILSAAGRLDDQAITLTSNIKRDEATLQLNDLEGQIGGAAIRANLTQFASSRLIDGQLTLRANDISAIAALALQEAAGKIDATIILKPDGPQQSADIQAVASNVSYQQNRIGSANIQASLRDLFGMARVDATLESQNIVANGTLIESLQADASSEGAVTRFDVATQLRQYSTTINAKGRLMRQATQQIIQLEALGLKSTLGNAALNSPTQVTFAGGAITLGRTQLNVRDGQLTLEGAIAEALRLDVNLSQLPLDIANIFAPALNVGGRLNGGIRIEGTAKAPRASFTLAGQDVSLKPLQDNGIAALTLNTSGILDLGAGMITLNTLNARNGDGVDVVSTGIIPFAGSGLNIRLDGTAPLNIAQRFLQSRGATVEGNARFNITALGSVQAPQLSGLLTVSNGILSDPLSNIRLTNIGLIAGLVGEQINIQRMNAQLSGGGAVSASGSIGISGDLPADIAVNLDNAGYSDGQTFATVLNGQMQLGGSLLRDPKLSGRINVGKTDITIPESFASNAELLEVSHLSPSDKTRRTLERLTQASPAPTPTSRPSILQLDLSINAPNQIFVRGRGLDAELGGAIMVRGPMTNLTPIGQFDLRRGRLSLLGQRFNLQEGSVTLTGSLDPLLSFTVQTVSGDVTAFIFLKGRASDLKVTFASQPELPEDEVLAQIIFGQSLSNLSPLQITRLAAIAVELTGGQSPQLVDGIRNGLGLDDLDVVDDGQGNAAVKAGKYINEKVYLGVQAGQETEATINLDITDSLTARGAVSSGGDTSLGVFFENDY